MVAIGDEVELDIISTCDNSGLARYEGIIVYVANIRPPARIKAKITGVGVGMAIAEFISYADLSGVYAEEEGGDEDDEYYPDEVTKQYEEGE